MPSAIQAMSRRYEFWKTPDVLQNTADRMSGRATWQLYAHEAEGLWPHVPSLGQTRDQLECRLPWQSPQSIGLCDSSWYLWCCDSSAQTSADGPPGFFLSPVSRVSTVWQGTAFSPLPSNSSGQSPVWWSNQGPESEADSLLGNQVPAKEIP